MGRRSREKASRRRSDAAPAVAPGQGERPTPSRSETPAPPLPIADDTTAVVPWADVWRRDGLAYVTLFVLAFAFRLAALVQTARGPFLEVANIDSASYQKWARELVASGWWPARHFYQSPFYAYFLGVLYRVFGDGPWAPRLLQIILGSLTPVLVYGIGTRLFTRRAGFLGALLVCLFGPLVLEEVTLSKTTPLVTIAVAGVAAYLRYGPGARAGGLALAGALTGLAVVGIAQWLLPFAVLVAWLPFLAADAPERWPVAVTAFVGAALLVLAPVVAWNSFHGGGLVLTSGGSGLNLYEGNNERATGLASSPPGLRDIPEYEEEDARRLAEKAVGRPLSPAEVDRYWSSQAWAFIRDHPGAWLRTLTRKLTVLWNAYEIPDNYHFAFMREHFLPVLAIGTTLAVVGPLALVGMLLPVWRRRGLVAFTLVWLAYMVTPLVYYVRGRYRLPLVPFLALLAGVGVERLVRAWQARRWDHLGALAAALVAATLLVDHTYCEPPHHGFDRLCFAGDMWYDLEWMKLAGFYQERGDLDGALVALRRASENSAPRGIGQMTFWRGDVEHQRADQLEAAGDRQGAAEHLRLARDAFRRCQQIKYRPDATTFHLSRIEERLATLE
jgi:4-amino-4-deoxy-L-arabinose transferase-like glycosyltransferase